jgi:hypothetical protein
VHTVWLTSFVGRLGPARLGLVIGTGLLLSSVGCSSNPKLLTLGPIPQDLLERHCDTGAVAFRGTPRPIRIRKSDWILPSSKKRVSRVGITHGKIVRVPIGNLFSEAIRKAAEQLVDEVKYDADLEACTIDFDIDRFTWCADEGEEGAPCTLECTVRFLDHEGRNVYLKRNRFCAEHCGAFDGEEVPCSVWQCAIDIACSAIDEMSQEKGVLLSLQR